MADIKNTFKSLLALSFMASVMIPAAAHSATREISARYKPETHAIEFHARTAEPLKVTQTTSEHEVLLTFSEGINVSGLVKAIQDSGGLFSNASTGFDTILLNAESDQAFDVRSNQNVVAVAIAPNTDTDREKTADSRGQLRLMILDARLKRETGNVHEAREMLLALEKQYPDDYRIQTELAATEEYFENWRGADRYYTRAHELAPLNEDILLAQKNLWDYHRPRIKLDHEWETRGSDTQFHITGLSGFAYVQPYTRVGFLAETNIYQTDVIRRADGRIKTNSGTRHREEVYLRHDYLDGDLAQVSLYSGYNSLGFGGRYKMLDVYGDTTFMLDYQKVNWEYVEGVPDGAVRDRIAFERKFPLTPLWDARLGAGYNRYGIHHEDDVARTVSLTGEIRYQLRQSDPLLTVGYVIDAEYRNDEETAVDSTGTTYMLLPIRSREIHFIDISMYKELNKDWVLQAFAGYGYDRLGGNGPAIGGSLTRGLHENLEAQIRASHSLSSDGSGDSLNRLGGYIMWKF